jgi:hypothetical protein
MQLTDCRSCSFCAKDKPIIVTIVGEPPAYVIACPECGATGSKSMPRIEPKHAIEVWNSRYVWQ